MGNKVVEFTYNLIKFIGYSSLVGNSKLERSFKEIVEAFFRIWPSLRAWKKILISIIMFFCIWPLTVFLIGSKFIIWIIKD